MAFLSSFIGDGVALVARRLRQRGLHQSSLMKAALLLVLTFAFCPFTFDLPSGGGGLLCEEAFDDLVTRLKGFAELLRLGAAAFGHVGLAAAAAADDGRKLFDDSARGDSLREVCRGTYDERSLAVG